MKLTVSTTDIPYDSGTLSDYLRFGISRTVDAIAVLRTLASSLNQRALVLGYYTKGDGGGGVYFIDTADTTSSENGGTIIVAADGARWKLARQTAISVKQFGAKGDGTTDDTARINACLAAAQSTYVPSTPGGYLITSSLVMPNSGTNLFGDGGSFSSFLAIKNQTFDLINVTAASDVEIRNLYAIDSANRGSTSGQLYFARFNTTSRFNVLNIGGTNIHSGILAGADGSTGGGANSRIEGCKFSRLGAGTGVGVHYGGSGEIRELINCTFAGPGSGSNGAVNALAGVRITGGTAIVIDDVEAPGCGTPLLVQPIAGSQVAHTKVSKFWCDSSSSVGMWLDGSLGRIINFSIDQSWFSSNGVGIRISGYAHDVVVMQAEIYQNRSDAIIIDSNADVLGLIIGGGTRIGGNAGSGISVGLNVAGFRVLNCNIGSSSHFGANANGIYLNGGNDSYDISHNSILGNTGSQIAGHMMGTATRIVKENIGYSTVVEGKFAGSTDASGLITVAHNLGRVPNMVFPSIFAGANPNAIVIQLVSYDANNAVFKVLSNNVVLGAASVTVYFRVVY